MRFKIRTLFVLAVLIAIPCAYFQHLRRREHIESDAIDELIEKGGNTANITFTVETSFRYNWLGNRTPVHVDTLTLKTSAFSDQDLDTIEKFERLKSLTLYGCEISGVVVERLPKVEITTFDFIPTPILDDPFGGTSP